MKKQTKCLIALFIIALAVLLAGCQRRRAQSKIQPGDYRESMIVDGRARTYLLHIPSGYTTGISLPLLLAFHGYGGEGENMEELSQFSALADKENFIVVYPDGFEKSWNHGDGSRPAVKENIDDIKFVRMLIEALEKKLPIDSSKIFATGFSNGALMTERLGCELADVLAGIAPVSGSMPKKIAPVCKPAKPIPFHLIYGIADPLSPYSGGALKNKGGEVLSVKDTLAFWAKQNGCLSSKEERLPQQVNDGTSVIKTAYQQCTKADTILYSIEGGGHAWPPSAPGLQHITGKSSKNLDASKVIWEFFKAASKDTMPQDELSPYKAGDYRESIDIDNRQRTYLLHIPSRYDPNKNYPLVLGFHGGGGSGEKFSGQTGFSDYADREGFITVFPDGIEHNWNDGRGTTDAERLGVDDVKFVRELAENLRTKLPINSKRIYATGVSNGGIFSHRLGCEMADVFAAIGPVIGSMPANIAPKCNPSKPISVVVIQGTEDPFIPIEGGDTKHKKLGIGDGGLVESAEDSMELWAEKNECKGTPKKEKLPVLVNDGTGAERIAYSQCKGESEVAYYIVNGMGHGWPPKGGETRREEVSGPTSHNIDATKVIWEFFKAHAKK